MVFDNSTKIKILCTVKRSCQNHCIKVLFVSRFVKQKQKKIKRAFAFEM